MKRLHDGEVVDYLRQMLPDTAQLGAGLTVPLERERGTEPVRHARDKREPLPLEKFIRARLAGEFAERRLVVKEVELTGRSSHVKINHMLGFSERSSPLRARRVNVGRPAFSLKHRGKRDRAEAEAELTKEGPPRDPLEEFFLNLRHVASLPMTELTLY